MGYKYENRLEEANEAEYWRTRPKWRRKVSSAAGWAFAVILGLAGAASIVITLIRLAM